MNRELIMSTLFARLTSPPLVYKFTADLSVGEKQLTGISDTSGLLLGMPLAGRGLAAGTRITGLDPTVTISQPITIGGSNVPLTQGIATAMRVLQPIGDITNLPGLCLVEGAEIYPTAGAGSPRAASNQPQIITLEPYAWLYAASASPNTVPNAIINVLLDAIDSVLFPTDGRSWQHLGLSGVHHCRIEGRTLRAPGSDGTVSARVQFGIQVLQGVPILAMP
jgi:hypothetical protein